MFVLRVNIVSNDSQYNFNVTSNNIRVVSPNITENSAYYHNFQLKFNGTFIQSQKSIYISTIYNYYLQKYSIELIGPVECVSGSVMFAAGIDQSNATVQSLLTTGSYNDSSVILPGYPLIYLLLNTYELNFTSKSLSSSQSSASLSSNSVSFSCLKKTLKIILWSTYS